MTDMKRRSPVVFPQEAKTVEMQDHWSVVIEYESEGPGPWIVDLSHRPRWDLQDRELDSFKPFGIDIPETPGQCCFRNNIMVNRLNSTQASLWQLTGDRQEAVDDKAYTDTGDATVFLAILGEAVFSIAEKLSSLDLGDPAITTPRLFQGPFAHVPCQIVVIRQTDDLPGILLTCSRGYSRDMVAAILHSGYEFNLRPAGQQAFDKWVASLA